MTLLGYPPKPPYTVRWPSRTVWVDVGLGRKHLVQIPTVGYTWDTFPLATVCGLPLSKLDFPAKDDWHPTLFCRTCDATLPPYERVS